MIFLVGCGGAPSGDRTPVGPIGIGSTKSYYCKGEWHYPQNYYEYDQTGLASWYGPGFHGKPKPYGEAFNMHGISAAHRTLPLPTVVKVTNLENGKCLKLVVDDRGPFVYEGRIIDLSAGAAKALGTFSKGLMTVRVQSIPDESRMLSKYLAKNGNKYGKMRDGRTWQQVYAQEIAGHSGAETVDPIPPKEIPKATPRPIPKAAASTLEPEPSLDDILDSVVEIKKPVVNSLKTHSPTLPLKTFINLGDAYVQKASAQKVAASLPKEWRPSVHSNLHSSGQMLYNIKLGPLDTLEDAQKVFRACQDKGFTQAIMIKD